MICKKPYVKGGSAYGCGQCLPCRYNKRRIWSHRIMLESLCHTHNSFVTLTYNNESIPLVSSVATRAVHSSLEPTHLRDFLKRLRYELEPLSVRFFAVGEYGDSSGRAHYHLCLFGYQTCLRLRTKRHFSTGEPDWFNCCPQCRLIGRKWGMGNVDLGELNPATATYTAEYTTKKMTKATDPRLDGRHPEFSRQSLKPGIGADAMWEVAASMLRFNMEDREDVPFALGHGKRELPLGRYLMGKLREYTGKEKNAPQATLDRIKEEMRPVREIAFNASRPLAEVIVEESAQEIANLEARFNIYRQRKGL